MANGDKQSFRHHYVPQFYINNFQDSNGKLFAYNKKSGEFFSPKSKAILYEEERNTFLNANNEKTVWIEDFYADIEKKLAPIVKKLQTNEKLQVEDMRMLLFLAYTNKWRSPAYDESFEIAQEELSFNDLRLHLTNSSYEVDLEKEWTSEDMQASKRILLAVQPFIYKDDYSEIFKNSFIITNPDSYSSLIGSCPFLENPVKTDVVFESFVMPLTKNHTLIHIYNGDKLEFADFWEKNENFRSLFYNLRDLSIFHVAENTVVSSSEERLKTIISQYDQLIKNGFDPRTIQALFFGFILNKEKTLNIHNKLSDFL